MAQFVKGELCLAMSPRALLKLHAGSLWSPASRAPAQCGGRQPRVCISTRFRSRMRSPSAGRSDDGVAIQRIRPDATHLRSRCSTLDFSGRVSATSAVAVSDVEDAVDLSEFVFTGGKVTSVAHGVWRKVVRSGDTVVDATCGNGHDTLALVKMVCADNALGYVYAFDVQEDALANSSYLLDQRLDSVQRKRVKLLRLCHSQLENIVGETPIRLVTFNLGYLPGGDHNVVTNVDTTIQALQSSSNVLQSGGLISVVAYVGHPGGREEYDAVMDFGSKLPKNTWVCSQHEWVNRPLSPRLILMFKR